MLALTATGGGWQSEAPRDEMAADEWGLTLSKTSPTCVLWSQTRVVTLVSVSAPSREAQVLSYSGEKTHRIWSGEWRVANMVALEVLSS